jgi:hypothetical protein
MATIDDRRELEALAETLWAERHVVEYLLFKLVTAKLVLGADERRFVKPALDEVSRVTGALRQADLTLVELAARAGQPMQSVFLDHRDGFRALAEQIEETTAANRQLAAGALASVSETLDGLTGPAMATTYTASGRTETGRTGPSRLDWVL